MGIEQNNIAEKIKGDVLKRKFITIRDIINESLEAQYKNDSIHKAAVVIGVGRGLKTKSLTTAITTMVNVASTITFANVGWDLVTSIERIKKA